MSRRFDLLDATKLRASDLTPDVLRHRVVFTGTGGWISKPGYLEDEVDDFLEVVADYVESLLRRINELEHPASATPLVEHWPSGPVSYRITEKATEPVPEEVWE